MQATRLRRTSDRHTETVFGPLLKRKEPGVSGNENRDVYDELAALRTELARQQQALATFRRAMACRTRRMPRLLGRRIAAALTAALLLALVPLSLLAAGPFTDLDPNSPHNDNIGAIQAAGITKGCN